MCLKMDRIPMRVFSLLVSSFPSNMPTSFPGNARAAEERQNVYIHTHSNSHTHTHMHARTPTHTRTYTHTHYLSLLHTHMHACTHAHTHTTPPPPPPPRSRRGRRGRRSKRGRRAVTLTDDGKGAQHFIVVLDAVGVVVVNGLQSLGTKPALVKHPSRKPTPS